MKNTIVFDPGGVLIDWNPGNLYRQLIGDAADIDTFLSEVGRPEWNEKRGVD
jgi:2-haloacid dehalogenase